MSGEDYVTTCTFKAIIEPDEDRWDLSAPR
jgi:hypothetical protein